VISYRSERGGLMSAALVVFLAAAVSVACGGTPARDLEIALTPATPTRLASITVSGLSSGELSALRGASLDDGAWSAILNVHVAGNDSLPVAGSYSMADDAI
jgi:hypothetical protein